MVEERFFILTPTKLNKTTTIPAHDGLKEQTFALYADAEGREYKWSGVVDVPQVNIAVNVRVNSLGPGKVVGFFTCGDYVGVMVKLSNPPDWWVKQNERAAKDPKTPKWRLEGICAVFGIEIEVAQ